MQGALEVALLAWLVYYFLSHGEEFRQALQIDLASAAAITALVLGSTLIRAWQLCYLVASLSGKLPMGESLALTTGCTLLNHLPMNAGTIIKAVILKRNTGVPYTHFLALMAGQVLANLLAGGLLGLAVIALPSAGHLHQRGTLACIFAGVLVACVASFYIPRSLAGEGGGWVRTSIRNFLAGLREIRRRRGSLFVLAGSTVLGLLLGAGRFWICFHVLNVEVSFVGSVVFAVIAGLLSLVNITPAGLGIREAMVGMVAAFTGEGFAAGVLASGLERVFTMGFFVVSGAAGLIVLKRCKII